MVYVTCQAGPLLGPQAGLKDLQAPSSLGQLGRRRENFHWPGAGCPKPRDCYRKRQQDAAQMEWNGLVAVIDGSLDRRFETMGAGIVVGTGQKPEVNISWNLPRWNVTRVLLVSFRNDTVWLSHKMTRPALRTKDSESLPCATLHHHIIQAQDRLVHCNQAVLSKW